MKINNLQMLVRISEYENNNKNSSIEKLLSSKKADNKKDLLIKSDSLYSGTYTSSLRNKYISKNILNILNNISYSNIRVNGKIVECGEHKFGINQIPPISEITLKEVSAENNVMCFGENTYFKYISKDGNEHSLFTTQKNGIGSIYSEQLRGASYDAELQKYAGFWNYLMSDDPVYIGLNYSDAQIREYMEEAKIEPGFFTVKMGEKEATQFYSATKTAGPIHSKERYDKQYEALTSGGGLLSKYAAGDIFKINGKEYTLKENHTLDISYGEDIYNIEYPSNYSYGRRIQ